MIPLPRHPHRFRLSRAGIHQVWQYDEVFQFGGGRLLLRGKNGAGKSKALEMLLPFLLDGDTRRLDAAGGGKTSLKWLMLDGWTQGTNRLGYLWVEFAREEGGTERLTLGAAVRASTSTGEAKPTYFVTRRAVGEELPLHEPTRRPSVAELRDLVGLDNCYARPSEYRARVARELFGLTDVARYRNLVHLLYGLRRPTIGDRIESGELVKVLSDALPPLDEEIIDRVARNLDDLDTVRDELARLERTDAALTRFLTAYRGYLRGVLRGRGGHVGDALTELRSRRRAAGTAEQDVSRLKKDEEQRDKAVTALERAKGAAEDDLRTLHQHPAYRALEDLREKRKTVLALQGSAGSAWTAAEVARRAETAAAERLCQEVTGIGGDLSELRGSLRETRRTSRACGIDDALLGEPPTATATVLSASVTRCLTDPSGAEREVVRPKAEALDPAIGADLATWRDRLTETDRVVTSRRRGVETLRADLKRVVAAERVAVDLRKAVERLEEQLTDAQDRRDERGRALIAASADYATRVRAWGERLPDADPLLALVALPGPGEDLPVAERSLNRDTPESVVTAAHDAADPVLRGYAAERDEALMRERTAAAELRATRKEKEDWERRTDPEPYCSRYSTAERAPGTGAPLFLLLDFADTTGDGDRAGLEAALEASGLLNAWVCADGTVLAADTQDVLLRGGDPLPGRSLCEALRPIPGHGVGTATVERVLGSIGLGATGDHCWVTTDGRWRLGIADGAYRKATPEYVGAAVRAETRQRRIAELTARIDELTAVLEAAESATKKIEKRLDELRRALREPPRARELTDAWTTYENAIAEVRRTATRQGEARREAEDALATAVRLRTKVDAQASADGLPADDDALGRLHGELSGLRTVLAALGRDAARILTRLETHADARGAWEDTRRTRGGAETDAASALARLTAARRELALLEESVGASEQEIMAREQDAQRRLDDATDLLPDAKQRHREARDELVRAEEKRNTTLTALREQEQIVITGGGLLRRPLGLPGLPVAAELGDVEPAVQAYDTAQDGDVRARIAALRALADDVGSRLGAARDDVSDSQILRRGEELRDGLAGGYDAGIDEVDGIKRVTLHDDTGSHDVAVVGRRIRAAVADARLQLSDREQDVFERYLLGELGDHLSRQVLAAHKLVATMNETLDEVRSSHGIGARLHWDLAPGADADVKTAVALLRRAAALRTREQSAQLRDALRRRIEEARLADPAAGYAVHLRTALDYRGWFAFKVKVTDEANPDRERVLSHRTALSQGEHPAAAGVWCRTWCCSPRPRRTFRPSPVRHQPLLG